MFYEQFQAGGPVMYAVFGAWVIVLAGVLDRLVYVACRKWRRPMRDVLASVLGGKLAEATANLANERRRASHGLRRIDSVSQLATSIGLFGTVLGIAEAFFRRASSTTIAPEALGAGLATALYTTIGGLVVYLFGQGFLILFEEGQAFGERHVQQALARATLETT